MIVSFSLSKELKRQRKKKGLSRLNSILGIEKPRKI